MSKKNCVKRFAESTHVVVAEGLNPDAITQLMSRVGVPSNTPTEQFLQRPYEIVSVCGTNGIQIRRKKNGMSENVWIAARFLRPANIEPVKQQA